MPIKQLAAPATTSTNNKLYSVPVHKSDKEFLMNEALRTGLSQKDIVSRAIDALQQGKPIPGALPVKL